MTTSTATDLTIDNFTERTGFRFRVTKDQASRIAVTDLLEPERVKLSTMSVEEAATFLKAKNTDGQPLSWVSDAISRAAEWNDSQSLTRQEAFDLFIKNGGLDRLKGRRPEIPDSVYLDPTLTLENFAQKVKDATGVERRFRVSREQNVAIEAGTMTRQQALAAIVASKKGN